MGLPYAKKFKGESRDSCMDHRRNFGTTPGQLTDREPLNPDLYMRVGTRVGTITAYYEHLTPSTTIPVPIPPSANPPVPPSIRMPIVNVIPALCEQTVPIQPTYDIPKKTHQ